MKRLMIPMLFLVITILSCKNDSKTRVLIAAQEIIVDSLPGECPYLTKDTKGNTVLSWARMLNDSTTAFCYALSKDGRSFDNPVVIPNSGNIQPHGENLPKIIFKPSGEIIALWGVSNSNPKNKYSGLISYTQSFDNGKTWTDPRPLVSDTASYDQRYYDIALLPNGEAGIIWLDNRKTVPEEGSGLYYACTNGNNGFQQEKLISQPCCQCCRTDLFVDSKGYIHTLYRGIIKDSIRDMVHAVSVDEGKTFSAPRRISDDNWVINGCPHTGPAMTETKEGLSFAWFTGGKNKGCYFSSSRDNGLSFSPRNSISEYGSHPQVVPLDNNDVVITWDETVQVDNKYYKKIGVQKRNAQGVSKGTDFITADTSTASYPVIGSVDGMRTVIAYAKKRGEKDYVAIQFIE